MHLRSILLGSLPGLLFLSFVGACASDDPPADCSTRVDLACVSAYDPTFDNLFKNTLKPSCALSGASCHAAAGHQAGVILEDPDSAHRTLIERGKAIAGKPECSPMARRITSTDVTFMMPPGRALPDGEKCAVIRWIAGGAIR